MALFSPNQRIVPTDRKTYAVYSMPCGDCEKIYLDQTKRQFARTRLKEHQTDVSNSNSSKPALAEDVCQTSHDIARNDSKITATNNHSQRLCLEAWHINANSCALNSDDGARVFRSCWQMT